MIEGLVGRWFCLVARLRPAEEGEPLDHVGQELRRLEAPRRQGPATSR